jgi:hypothetical protein
MRCFTYKGFLISALCLLLSALPSWACPYCKETIAGITGMAQGFSWSVILMLTVPLVVVGVISAIIIKAYRKHPNSL